MEARERYKLLAEACSGEEALHDYVFWVREVPDEEYGGKVWEAHEIESGVKQRGLSAREAIDMHFRADTLDLPRITMQEPYDH